MRRRQRPALYGTLKHHYWRTLRQRFAMVKTCLPKKHIEIVLLGIKLNGNGCDETCMALVGRGKIGELNSNHTGLSIAQYRVVCL